MTESEKEVDKIKDELIENLRQQITVYKEYVDMFKSFFERTK